MKIIYFCFLFAEYENSRQTEIISSKIAVSIVRKFFDRTGPSPSCQRALRSRRSIFFLLRPPTEVPICEVVSAPATPHRSGLAAVAVQNYLKVFNGDASITIENTHKIIRVVYCILN